MKQAISNDIIYKNVASSVILPRKVKKEIRVLTREEQATFMSVANDSPPYGFIFILVLGTGLRIGEALALEWSDIDFEIGILSVNKTIALYKDCDDPESKAKYLLGTPKTQSSNRKIPLLPELLQELRELKEQSINNLIFPGPTGGHCHPQTVRYHFKKELMIANIPRIDELHLHSLRHTFATRGLEDGIELKVMQEFLGHASIKETADTYTHVLPCKKRDSIMKLQETMRI